MCCRVEIPMYVADDKLSFNICVGSFTAPREWLIPPSTNINVYAAAEQLTFQMI